MSSPIYKEWVAEERREAMEKGIEKATRENIMYLLETKFEFVPRDIQEEIDSISDLSTLRGLLKRMLTVSRIEEFEELLDKIKMLG